MTNKIVLIIIFIAHIAIARITQKIDFSKFDKAKLDAKSLEAVKNIHFNWYQFSIKALMGKLGKDLYEQMPSDQKDRLAKCLNTIDDKRDLVKSARCLVNARRKYKRSLEIGSAPQARNFSPLKQQRISSNDPIALKESWTGAFMVKNNKESNIDISPLARPKNILFQGRKSKWATNLNGSVLMDKEKYSRFSPRKKRSPYRLGNMDFEEFVGEQVKDLPTWKVTNFIRNIYHQFDPHGSKEKDKKPIKWTKTYEKLLHVKEELARKEKLPGAKIYGHRMYDLVLGNDRPTLSPKESRTPQGLLQMAMNMIETVKGNRTNRDSGNVKFLSPRVAPLMPDKSESKSSHLSPTIFAFYEEKHDNKSFASIPTILKATGLNKSDRDKVLELLMDVSGTTKHVGDALNLLEKLNFLGMEGEIFSVTEKIATAYDLLEKSFNVLQSTQIKNNGYTFLEKHQMMKLYRDQGVKIPGAEKHLDEYDNIKAEEREEALWARIERIALNRPDNFTMKSRSKRQISVLSPVVLAPYMFTPVFGLTVLGPVILSPSLFSPLINNPAVLSPYILSPGVPMPEILSPYVLCPYILSPLALAPFVLTPYVLSPNIINPYALSPVILSPFVLSPDILSPAVLGGPILSPNVGSPSVLTEGYLTANVLSPSFLS